jgi:flavoprotein
VDQNDFLKKLTQVAKLKNPPDTGPGSKGWGGVAVDTLLDKPRSCGDCGLIVNSGPRRVITYRTAGRLVRCVDCGKVKKGDKFGPPVRVKYPTHDSQDK